MHAYVHAHALKILQINLIISIDGLFNNQNQRKETVPALKFFDEIPCHLLEIF